MLTSYLTNAKKSSNTVFKIATGAAVMATYYENVNDSFKSIIDTSKFPIMIYDWKETACNYIATEKAFIASTRDTTSNSCTKTTGLVDTAGTTAVGTAGTTAGTRTAGTTATTSRTYYEWENNWLSTGKNGIYILGGVAIVYSGYQLYHYGWLSSLQCLYNRCQEACSVVLPFPTRTTMHKALDKQKECINSHSENIKKSLENKLEQAEEDIVYHTQQIVSRHHEMTQEKNNKQCAKTRRFNEQEHDKTRKSCQKNINTFGSKIVSNQQKISQENTNNTSDIIDTLKGKRKGIRPPMNRLTRTRATSSLDINPETMGDTKDNKNQKNPLNRKAQQELVGNEAKESTHTCTGTEYRVKILLRKIKREQQQEQLDLTKMK